MRAGAVGPAGHVVDRFDGATRAKRAIRHGDSVTHGFEGEGFSRKFYQSGGTSRPYILYRHRTHALHMRCDFLDRA